MLDETEKLSSIATDLKRKLDNMELELARPPKPMWKKQIIARYEKLPKMGRSTQLTVPRNVNNNKLVAAHNDQQEVLKKPKQLTVSVKTKLKPTEYKSESKRSPSKHQKSKFSHANGDKRQRKIKKVSHYLALMWTQFLGLKNTFT